MATWVRLTLLCTFKHWLPFSLRTLLCVGDQDQRCTPRDSLESHLEDTLKEAFDLVDEKNEPLEEERNSNTTLIALCLKHNII